MDGVVILRVRFPQSGGDVADGARGEGLGHDRHLGPRHGTLYAVRPGGATHPRTHHYHPHSERKPMTPLQWTSLRPIIKNIRNGQFTPAWDYSFVNRTHMTHQFPVGADRPIIVVDPESSKRGYQK